MLKKVRRYLYNITHPVIGEVWQLHRVTNEHSDTELQRTYEITPNRLESLILQYQSKGYIFVSMKDVRQIMLGEKKIKNKFVSLTLDDGYRDNYEIAYPIFKKYNIPFCIYLLQCEIIGDKQGHYPMLTEKQIVMLDKNPLCTIGGHTYSHPHLGCLGKNEQYNEIVKCKEWIENLLGHDIEDYSYPFGSYNNDTIEVLKSLNIKQCTMAWGGKVRRTFHPKTLEIPRVLISQNT